ncbi:MAG TPA: sugar phosphate isomerase/epimerase family protein [Limnochordia bacterium]|nr:sugar phosphate isomerase/epimerase family protein [Limnochordia bacterium]
MARFRYGICNETFKGWEWARICDFVAETGYDGLEVAPFTLAKTAFDVPAETRLKLRERASAAGLDVLGLHWLYAGTEGLHLTHPDAEVRARTGDYLAELTRLCSDLGGWLMVLGSPQQRNLRPGVTTEAALGYAAEVIERALPVMEERDVTLALEPLRPAETNFMQSAAEAVQLIRRVDHPKVRLHLDVKAMEAEAEPVPQVIAANKAHLAHFHVNDPNLLGPGMGEVAYEPIIAALDAAGYKGYLSVEVFAEGPGPEAIARQSLEYLRRVVGE